MNTLEVRDNKVFVDKEEIRHVRDISYHASYDTIPTATITICPKALFVEADVKVEEDISIVEEAIIAHIKKEPHYAAKLVKRIFKEMA